MMSDPTTTVFELLSEINELAAEIENAIVPAGDAEGEVHLLALNNSLARAVEELVDVPTTPGSHAWRAQSAAVARYFRLARCTPSGDLADDGDLVDRAVWSVLSDAVGGRRE